MCDSGVVFSKHDNQLGLQLPMSWTHFIRVPPRPFISLVSDITDFLQFLIDTAVYTGLLSAEVLLTKNT